MAYLVPSDISTLALAGAHSPELTTLALLKRTLGAAYTVFHGVHWSRAHRGYMAFGEIDFVVVDQTGRVLVIEQKNGPLEETGDDLVKHYPDGAKSVGDQVRRSLEGVREKFKRQHRGHRLRIDYLIYCPDHRIARLSAAGIDRERIVDAGDGDLAGRIEALMGPGGAAPGDEAERVLAFFRQTFEVVPDIHAHVAAQGRAFTRLSGGLAGVIEHIEMTPLRLRVRGTAGCGKSVVALAAHRRAVAAGRRALLVCFNRPLKESLAAAAPPGGLVETWHGLCIRFLEDCGHRIRFEAVRDPSFWPGVFDGVLAEAVPERWRFDSVVVDEGQDFEPDWVETLQVFWAPDADVLWLEDPEQNLRRTGPAPLEGFVGFRADANYRTPATIARFIQRVLGVAFECANDLPGLGAQVFGYDEPGEQPALVATRITELVRRGFDPADVVVLSLMGTRHSALSGLDRVGAFTLSRFEGDYDAHGNQIRTAGQVRLESIQRFKGQQAPAVLLVDVDPSDPDDRALFTAMTRPTVRLEILARRGNPATAALFS